MLPILSNWVTIAWSLVFRRGCVPAGYPFAKTSTEEDRR